MATAPYSLFGWSRVPPRRKPRKPARPVPRAGVITVGAGASPGGYTPPTPGSLETQAGAKADAQIAREQAEIEKARAAREAANARAVEMLKGLGVAQNEMLKGIPDQVYGIGAQAGKDIAAIGGAVADSFASGAQSRDSAAAADIQAQTGMTASPSIDVDAARKALYAQTGAIPGQEQIEMGTASAQAAAGMPAVVARATTQEVSQRLAAAATEDADFRQKLIEAAAKRPEVYADALAELYDLEKSKFGLYEANERLKMDKKELALRIAAQKAAEKQLGIKNSQQNRSLALRENQLRLSEKKYALDVQKAERAGRKIDAQASKVLGYVVDVNGDAVLNANGDRIKVSNTSGANQAKKDRMAAIKEARGLRGKLVEADLDLHRGKYIAQKGAKGVFPDGSTNDPNKAMRRGGMSFAEAVTYVASRYGVSRSVARQWVVASGWKPDGKRP